MGRQMFGKKDVGLVLALHRAVGSRNTGVTGTIKM